MKSVPWMWVTHRTDLPRWLKEAIGTIAIEWSAVEDELSECIRRFLNVPIKDGRIMTTGMSAKARMTTVTNLIQMHVFNRKLDASFLQEWADLWETLKEIETTRNSYLHGTWGKVKRKWNLQMVSGVRTVMETRPEIKKLSRAVLPHRKPVSRASMMVAISEITTIKKKVSAWRERVSSALPPSPHIPIGQMKQHRRPQIH